MVIRRISKADATRRPRPVRNERLRGAGEGAPRRQRPYPHCLRCHGAGMALARRMPMHPFMPASPATHLSERPALQADASRILRVPWFPHGRCVIAAVAPDFDDDVL